MAKKAEIQDTSQPKTWLESMTRHSSDKSPQMIFFNIDKTHPADLSVLKRKITCLDKERDGRAGN